MFTTFYAAFKILNFISHGKHIVGFRGGSNNKESSCNAGNTGSIPGSERPHSEEGNGYPLQYSCLENLTDRGAWRATDHGVAELDTMERLALSVFDFYNHKTTQFLKTIH